MNCSDEIVYSVPNQSMPGLLDFSLHFHVSNLYCDIDLEEEKLGTTVEIIWQDNNSFSASAFSEADDTVVGSTVEFTESDFMDINELGIEENEISKIIEKGNELYKDFLIK